MPGLRTCVRACGEAATATRPPSLHQPIRLPMHFEVSLDTCVPLDAAACSSSAGVRYFLLASFWGVGSRVRSQQKPQTSAHLAVSLAAGLELCNSNHMGQRTRPPGHSDVPSRWVRACTPMDNVPPGVASTDRLSPEARLTGRRAPIGLSGLPHRHAAAGLGRKSLRRMSGNVTEGP